MQVTIPSAVAILLNYKLIILFLFLVNVRKTIHVSFTLYAQQTCRHVAFGFKIRDKFNLKFLKITFKNVKKYYNNTNFRKLKTGVLF